MDRITSQVLLFENNYKKENVHVPMEIMNDHPGATFRFDLLDCHVDICSPELMLQFSDNFDYQNIRRDFIQNEVVNWDLGNTPYHSFYTLIPSLTRYSHINLLYTSYHSFHTPSPPLPATLTSHQPTLF